MQADEAGVDADQDDQTPFPHDWDCATELFCALGFVTKPLTGLSPSCSVEERSLVKIE